MAKFLRYLYLMREDFITSRYNFREFDTKPHLIFALTFTYHLLHPRIYIKTLISKWGQWDLNLSGTWGQ